MKIGNKKTFVYLPRLGFIEVGVSLEETMERIKHEEMKREKEDKKMLRRLKKENPGKNIFKVGDGWLISETPFRLKRGYFLFTNMYQGNFKVHQIFLTSINWEEILCLPL